MFGQYGIPIRIEQEGITVSAFGLVFGTTGLALALAFGLGGRDVAADYLKRWLAEKKTAAKK